MRALVVYESMYGNTAAVGEAIAESLRSPSLEVVTGSVSTIAPDETAEFDLLVVGGPTHAHGMSRPATRRVAADDQKNTFAEPTVEPGLRGWLDRLPPGTERLAAAFDTRFDKPIFITGSAAKGSARKLRHLGYRMVVEPESFFVTSESRLEEGQSAHAASWAAGLAERLAELAPATGR